jgi:hypothetical protein
MEAIEKMLNLKEKLDEKGIDTSQLNENIKEASEKLSQRLSALLTVEPEVVMKAELIQIQGQQDVGQKYLTSGDEASKQ